MDLRHFDVDQARVQSHLDEDAFLQLPLTGAGVIQVYFGGSFLIRTCPLLFGV